MAVRLRGARADQDHRDLAGAAHELGVERQAGLGVEHHPAGLATRPRHGAVSSGSSCVAVWMPDGDRVALGAPAVRSRAAGLAGDPLRVARAGGDLAVEGHGRLEDHQRTARAGVLAEGLVEQARGLADLAVEDVDLDALVAQDAQPAAGGLLARVVGGDHHARDARPRRSRPCRAACAPCGSMARATRTWWRRWGPPRRHSGRPARRGARPRWRGSPRRSSGRPSRSPRRPAGWARCARARWRPARWPVGDGACRALWPLGSHPGGRAGPLTRESTIPRGPARAGGLGAGAGR